MNERIKQLALQAKCMAEETINKQISKNAELDAFAEKFAELIVAEMLQTCEDHPAWTGRMIGEEIKQHFGVEE